MPPARSPSSPACKKLKATDGGPAGDRMEAEGGGARGRGCGRVGWLGWWGLKGRMGFKGEDGVGVGGGV